LTSITAGGVGQDYPWREHDGVSGSIGWGGLFWVLIFFGLVFLVAWALESMMNRSRGDPLTGRKPVVKEGAKINENEALDRARAYAKELGHVTPCVPTAPVYDHDPAEYFFFSLYRGVPRVGGDEIIAVRKSDGRVSYGGLVGE
jgi:hypothetical protein